MPSTRRRRNAHRRAMLALLIVVLLLAMSAGATAFAYTNLKDQGSQLQADLTLRLQNGQHELEAGKGSLKDANNKHDHALVSQAEVHFATAKLQFMAAQQIADSSQLLLRLEAMPEVGEWARSRHAAVDGIAAMGMAIADAGWELAKLDAQLIRPTGNGGPQGRTLLTVLNETGHSLVIGRKQLDLALKAAARVDFRVLPAGQVASFLQARSTIASALAATDEFARLVPVVRELLGGNGARTYLIEQVNPAELRPGGGFIGTYSVLQADQGALKLIRSGSVLDLVYPRAAPGQPGYVTPPGPFREWIPNTGWSLMDSNFFPDFPSNATTAESFTQPRIGIQIDGVLSMDYYTVAKMLELTGPLTVPGYGITATSANFVQLVVELYRENTSAPTHKAILAAMAGPLMDRVATLPPDRWPALLGALNDLAAARHLQAYFNNTEVEKEINQVEWSGVVNPTGASGFMMEVESNLGGTKANYWLTRQFTVELTRSGSRLHHKVTIDLRDDMPFYFRPDEYYSAYLRLYIDVTASSTTSNLRPARYPNPAPPAGTRMIDGWVPLFHGYGHSAQAVFEYDTPWVASGRGVATIYWQKQPGTLADKVEVRWNDGSGHVSVSSADLAQDRVIFLSRERVTIAAGKPAQATLPSLSLG